MLGTALLIVIGLVIVGACILGLTAGQERRINPRSSAPDESGAARDEDLRRIARDIAKGSGGGFF